MRFLLDRQYIRFHSMIGYYFENQVFVFIDYGNSSILSLSIFHF